MSIERIDYCLVQDRLRIGQLRFKAIEYAAGIAVSLNAIPIALGALFQLSELPEASHFWTTTSVGWIASAISISAAVLFILSIPRHVERYAGGIILNATYVVCAIGLFVAAIAFMLSAHAVITYAPPVVGR